MRRRLGLQANASRRQLLEKRYDVRDLLSHVIAGCSEAELQNPESHVLRAILWEYREKLRWLEEHIGKMPRQPEDAEYEQRRNGLAIPGFDYLGIDNGV